MKDILLERDLDIKDLEAEVPGNPPTGGLVPFELRDELTRERLTQMYEWVDARDLKRGLSRYLRTAASLKLLDPKGFANVQLDDSILERVFKRMRNKYHGLTGAVENHFWDEFNSLVTPIVLLYPDSRDKLELDSIVLSYGLAGLDFSTKSFHDAPLKSNSSLGPHISDSIFGLKVVYPEDFNSLQLQASLDLHEYSRWLVAHNEIFYFCKLAQALRVLEGDDCIDFKVTQGFLTQSQRLLYQSGQVAMRQERRRPKRLKELFSSRMFYLWTLASMKILSEPRVYVDREGIHFGEKEPETTGIQDPVPQIRSYQ